MKHSLKLVAATAVLLCSGAVMAQKGETLSVDQPIVEFV